MVDVQLLGPDHNSAPTTTGVGIRVKTIVVQPGLLVQAGIRARIIEAQPDLLGPVGIRVDLVDLVDTDLIRTVLQGVALHSNAMAVVVDSEDLVAPVLPLVDLKVEEGIDLLCRIWLL